MTALLVEKPGMAKSKGRPKGKASEPTPRTTIINLKGTDAQAEWLEGVHRKTHLSKTMIVRLALAAWAETNGHQAFPLDGGDE